MISGVSSLGGPLNQSEEVTSTSHGSSSAIPSPVEKKSRYDWVFSQLRYLLKRLHSLPRLTSKSNSAPPSPVKHVVASPKGVNDKSTNAVRNNRKRSQMSGGDVELVTGKKLKLATNQKSSRFSGKHDIGRQDGIDLSISYSFYFRHEEKWTEFKFRATAV